MRRMVFATPTAIPARDQSRSSLTPRPAARNELACIDSKLDGPDGDLSARVLVCGLDLSANWQSRHSPQPPLP